MSIDGDGMVYTCMLVSRTELMILAVMNLQDEVMGKIPIFTGMENETVLWYDCYGKMKIIKTCKPWIVKCLTQNESSKDTRI